MSFYASEEGGRKGTAFPGWGCPCLVSQMEPLVGYDAFPQMGWNPVYPGDKRRLGFVFLSSDGAEVIKAAGKFYLWEGGFIGEARVLHSEGSEDCNCTRSDDRFSLASDLP